MKKLKSEYLIYIVLLFCACPSFLQAQDLNLVFRHMTIDDGLSNGNVRQVFQDSQGFMWICTEDGLNFFDGYTFKVYKHNASDRNSISNNNVTSIIEDDNGYLWVGTYNGLNLFDRKSQEFKRYFSDAKNTKSISNNHITKFCFDLNNQLWIGTENGLNRYNPVKDNFTLYNVIEDLSGIVKGNSITALVCDHNGYIWTSEYYSGMNRLDVKTGSVKNYPVNAKGSFLTDIVISMCLNPNGNIWLGLLNGQLVDFDPGKEKASYFAINSNQTVGNNSVQEIIHSNNFVWLLAGKVLVRFEIKNKTFSTYSNNPLNPESLPKGTPYSITQTHDGNIWIGLEGIVSFNPKAEKFSPYYYILPKESSKIRQNYVTSFLRDKESNLYIGTFMDGLLKLHRKSGQYTRLTSSPVFSGTVISSIYQRKDGKLWISTSLGLVLFDPDMDKIVKHYTHIPNDPVSLYYNFVGVICEDKNNKLWIGTQESLDVFNPETNAFMHYTRENLNGLSNYKVTAILEDRSGFIWVGTFNGLNKIDPKTNKVTQYLPSQTKQNEISDPYVNRDGIYQDKAGFIWICTKNGLNRYDAATNSFNTYFQSDGLLSDNVYQMQEDGSGNLWVTSDKGISKINLKNKVFRNYTSLDGLNMSAATFYKDKSGFFYVGGRHENYYCFHPDSIHDNMVVPKVYITNLLLFNKPVGISSSDNNSPLTESILTTTEIVLNYKQSDFAFEFTALNYNLPQKNRFAYKMEGFNKDWIYTDANQRIASYTNLKHGNYIFRVKAANNDGIWNEAGTSIKIKILPAPWETNFALFIYALIILTSLYLARRIMLRQIHLNNSLRLEQMEHEKDKEFDQIKTNFFTNISHEFRTPLTLISGPVNKLISSAGENKSDENVLKYYYLIERNVKRLTQLTNQLLDFRKIETGTMKLELYQGDLVSYTRNIFDRFFQFAKNENITLKFSSSEKYLEAWFDPDKLDKIISNLLSNALKFTPKNGKVSISVARNESNPERVILKVKDTGIGILPEHINTVFNRFYQVDSSNTSIFEGTGIGLALARDMAKLCNGDITVNSVEGKGSTFTVDLPAELKHFENYRIITQLKEETSESEADNIDETLPDIQHTGNKTIKIIDSNTPKPIVLIIEDNKDLRFYINDILSPSCITEEAEDGIQGLEKAFMIIPDIIICDIRMPGKDGIEVTRTLKSDNRTSHIPVILLTAMSTLENKLKGLETGADDYITKPFNADILLLKVKNRITIRERAKEFFIRSIEEKVNPNLQGINIQPKEIIINSLDEKFLYHALEIVEQNISDPEFNVDKFSAAVAMEASTLYKKLIALINMPPGEFIRDIRMKRAVQLLKQNKVPISEIAYMVGFDNPNYFSKVFRKYYNISPSDFILRQEKNEPED